MSRLIACVICLFATSAFAEQALSVTRGAGAVANAGWSPAQATGEPNTPGAGDSQLAWATMAADAGIEWLEVDFPEAAPILAVRIHQNDNPGAIVKIEARGDGDPVVIWEGDSPKKPAPFTMEAKAATKVSAKTVRIILDTRRVSGWNEIDAVELLGRDGSRQWASAARASSTYATAGGGAQGGIWALVGKAVEVHAGGLVHRGKVKTTDGAWLTLDAAGRETLININRIDWIRAAQ